MFINGPNLLKFFMPFVISIMFISKKNKALIHSGDILPSINHSKWIVLTSISVPTENVKKFAKLENWKVIVVGDQTAPSNWNFSDVVFLSPENQENLGFKMAKLAPYISYSRKMIGYLYAIKNGARYIYDTDEYNQPFKKRMDFRFKPNMSGLIYDDIRQSIVNPLPHFGQPDLWPRGYPLESISIKPNNSYRLCTFKTPAIQQGLVNRDPDVDAIYSLINKGESGTKTINVTFDGHAPPLVLPSGVFSTLISKNTLYFYEAFWALYLPSTVDFRVKDIWKGYWAQKLLWSTGQYLAVFPPNAVQYKSARRYLKDFDQEIQLYEEAGKLVDFLSKWECQSKSSFFKCVKELSLEMAKQHFWKNEEYELIEAWIEDLTSIGYHEPAMNNISLDKMCLETGTKKYNQVYFTKLNQKSTINGYINLYNFCKNGFLKHNISIREFVADLPSKITPKVSYTFKNTLLVIVLNQPILKKIRFLEALYRNHFPNMLFCSETQGYEHLMSEMNSGIFPWRRNGVSFVNVSSTQGWLGYECAIRAIEMNYRVDGYLFLSDDVLFRPWKMKSFNFQTSAIQKEIYLPLYFHHRFNYELSWPKWHEADGGNATNRVMDEIESLAKISSHPQKQIFQTFIKNRHENKINSSLVLINLSDIYYISSNDSYLFSQILKIFLKQSVFSEIAVPTAFSGCKMNDPAANQLLGKRMWSSDTISPIRRLTHECVYVYPLKFGRVINETDYLKDYCLGYIHDYLRNW